MLKVIRVCACVSLYATVHACMTVLNTLLHTYILSLWQWGLR